MQVLPAQVPAGQVWIQKMLRKLGWEKNDLPTIAQPIIMDTTTLKAEPAFSPRLLRPTTDRKMTLLTVKMDFFDPLCLGSTEKVRKNHRKC